LKQPSGSLRHLARLTDDTGILEHAIGCVPRRKEGYSTDDQARALWVCLEWIDVLESPDADQLDRLIDTYLAFLLWAQHDEGHFHNNFAFDRTKETETPSDDCLGRCLWACASAMIKLAGQNRAFTAEVIFRKAAPLAEQMRSPRGWAYALAAFSLLERHSRTAEFRPVIRELAERLIFGYKQYWQPGWQWYEPILAYSNGVIPWGLLCAYEALKQEEWLSVAKESLDFLIRMSVNDAGQIRPIGNQGWCTPRHRALWDQQPIEVMKLALAAAKAYETTGLAAYADVASKCRNWFFGDNDAGTAMIDPEGGCYDGLSEHGPNRNQGAEAIISYLLTEILWLKLPALTSS